MIATCKLCQHIILPTGVLNLKPAVIAKMPADQLELLKFSAAVTDHVRTAHPEFTQRVQQLAGNFLGHCAMSTVDPVGDNANEFRAMCEADNNQLRANWEAMPNPPHPDIMARLAEQAHAAVTAARELDTRLHRPVDVTG